MVVKRLISDKNKKKSIKLKKYKGKTVSQLSSKEKEELLELIAKRLDLL